MHSCSPPPLSCCQQPLETSIQCTDHHLQCHPEESTFAPPLLTRVRGYDSTCDRWERKGGSGCILRFFEATLVLDEIAIQKKKKTLKAIHLEHFKFDVSVDCDKLLIRLYHFSRILWYKKKAGLYRHALQSKLRTNKWSAIQSVHCILNSTHVHNVLKHDKKMSWCLSKLGLQPLARVSNRNVRVMKWLLMPIQSRKRQRHQGSFHGHPSVVYPCLSEIELVLFYP